MKSALRLVFRLALGVLLVWAGMSKLADPAQFFNSIAGYGLSMPVLLQAWIAAGLPWLELILGGLIIGGGWRDTTAATVAALFGGFAILTAQAWLRGLEVDCGCFHPAFLEPWLDENALRALSSPGGATLRNVCLFGAAVWLALLERGRGRNAAGSGGGAAAP